MACRIGITTDLERRRMEWKKTHPDLFGWKVLDGPFSTKNVAQNREAVLARTYDCTAHPGGDDSGNNAKWWVYIFYYND